MTARRAVLVGLYVAGLSQAATLLRYPYLQNVRADRATILWTTRESGEGTVQFSSDSSFSRVVIARTRSFLPAETQLAATFYQYQAEITGLTISTEYRYRVLVDEEDVAPKEDLRFRTAGDGPFTFLALGDSGQATPAQAQLAQLMLKETPALILHLGDIAYESGTYDQFQKNYFDYYKDLMKRVPFFTTPGNHEYVTNFAAPYLAVHAPPTDTVPLADRGRYYSFDWGNVHFISLDSNQPLADAVGGTGPMLQWLESDLQKTQQTWRIVFFHHPPYLVSNHEDDEADALVRSNVVPVLDKYPIDLVLNGHEHNYQHTLPLRGGQPIDPGFGPVYIISGGGGAVLHPVFPNPLQVYAEGANHYLRAEVQGLRMTIHAIRADGQEIDKFTIEPRFAVNQGPPQISSDAVVNAASFTRALAPGMLVSIFGQNLGQRATQASSFPLPTQMFGTTVTLNNVPLPLLYVSPNQINAQLPFALLGEATLRVSNPNGASEARVSIFQAAPGIFSVAPNPAILHASGTLVSAASPAQPGEMVSIYSTGLGDVNGSIAAGQPAPSPPLATRVPVQAQLGTTSLTPTFAGLAPGFVGLYQVNLQVPTGLSSGAYKLQLVATGTSSNPVNLSVR